MITTFNQKWHGVAALMWLLSGFGVTVLIHRFLSESENIVVGFLFIVWVFVGWLGPSLFLALSGAGKGHPASRICAILALVTFLALVSAVVLLAFSHR